MSKNGRASSLSLPFESMALDLVGPQPKGKGGMCYLLTGCCIATRWPDVVPLKSATATAVAEGCMVMLAHQGSQSVRNSCRSYLELVEFPQCNGILERFHGTFKPTLAKASKMEWTQ